MFRPVQSEKTMAGTAAGDAPKPVLLAKVHCRERSLPC